MSSTKKQKCKKVSSLVASVLVGTNLASLTVGTARVFAVENKPAATASSIKDELSQLNKVSNSGFENDYKSNKNNWSYSNNQRAKVVKENGNSFGQILKGSKSEHIFQTVTLTPGKTYKVSAKIKVTGAKNNSDTGIFLAVKHKNANGQQGAVIKETKITGNITEWTKQEFTFEAPEDAKEAFVGLVKWSENNSINDVEAYIDDVQVIEEDEYQLVWEDDFTDDKLNQDIWGYELGSIRGNEQQHYVDSKDNVFLKDGKLVLNVTERDKEDQYRNPRDHANKRQIIYNSGSVRTHGNMEFLYGRIEMKAKLPKGKGAFPAFWTLGADFNLDGDINENQGHAWPTTGEIDIMEIIGAPTEERAKQGEKTKADNSNKVAYGTPHFYYINGDRDKDGSYSPYALGGNLTIDEDFYNNYHVFGINWSPDKIEWYVDGVVYNTMYLSGDARLEAAGAGFNRPQYIQLNLATGGNWAGDAGNHLAEDGTKFEIDWVRWSQNAEQKAAAEAYYKDNPKLSGVKDVTMLQGETPNLLEGVSVDKADYKVEFSIDDEYMFSNAGGLTDVTLRVDDSKDLNGLKSLAPGVYNIHYSAVPKDADISGRIAPKHKIKRETSLLTVLPIGENAIKGKEGDKLSSIKMPAGWKWENADQVLSKDKSYKIIFNNIEEKEVAGKERTITIEVPGSKIIASGEAVVTPVTVTDNSVMSTENIILDGNKEAAVKASEDLQASIKKIMELGSGTVTFRYRLDESMLASKLTSLMTVSDMSSNNAYASFYMRPDSNQIGVEFTGTNKKAVQVGSSLDFNFIRNLDWQTVSYVFDGKTMTVYLNGDKFGSANFTGLFDDLSWKDTADTITVGGNQRNFNGKDQFQWAFNGLIDTVKVQEDILSQDEIKEEHKSTIEEVVGEKFGMWDKYDEDIFEYRIPTMVKTPQGTLVAASDARKKHYNDWGDISTVVRTSTDNGKTWSDNIVVLDMPTQPYFTKNYSTADWNTNHTQSAFSIDPILLTDSKGKLYMLVDVFPESQGAVHSKAGSGYEKIDGKLYLNLYDFDNKKYTVRENGIVYDAAGKATDMYVSEGDFETAFSTKGDLYQKGKNGAKDTYLGNIYLRSGRNKTKVTREGSKTAPLFTHMTSFLWLFTSEDQGKTWSKPVDITGSVKEDWMGFIGTGAASGIEVKAKNEKGEDVNRLIFPIYYTNQQLNGALGRQSSANVYSDDGGKTWHRGESPNDGRIYGDNKQINSKDLKTEVSELTENQIVQLNNGHLLQFMRNTGETVVIARSTDYGKTWDNDVTISDIPEPYVNLSAIHMNMDGKEYIVLSNPYGVPGVEQMKYRNLRMKGILRVGEVQPDDSIKWVASELIEPKRFAYSSLAQLDDENVGMLYEHDGHIKYSTFNIKEMVKSGEKFDLTYVEGITKEVKKAEGNTEDKIQPKDEIIFTVKTNANTFMIGERQLDIKIGDANKKAKYISGNGTDTFLFSYVVEDGVSGDITVSDEIQNTTIQNSANNGALTTRGAVYNLGSTEDSLKVKEEVPTGDEQKPTGDEVKPSTGDEVKPSTGEATQGGQDTSKEEVSGKDITPIEEVTIIGEKADNKQNAVEGDKKSTNKLPKTGGQNSTIMIIAGLSSILASAGFLRRKKSNK